MTSSDQPTLDRACTGDMEMERDSRYRVLITTDYKESSYDSVFIDSSAADTVYLSALDDQEIAPTGRQMMISPHYLPTLSDTTRLTHDAWRRIEESSNPAIAYRARNLLNNIQYAFNILERSGADLSGFPAVAAGPAEEDGSLVIEIPFEDYRIGFGIEAESSESGWFLFSVDEAGCVTASGKLDGDLNSVGLMSWLLLYAFINE